MDPQQFELILDRFESMETLIRDNNKALDTHLLDAQGHDAVHDHATYWRLLSWLIGVLLVALIGSAAGWAFH